jgi:hypothetical protein
MTFHGFQENSLPDRLNVLSNNLHLQTGGPTPLCGQTASDGFEFLGEAFSIASSAFSLCQ